MQPDRRHHQISDIYHAALSLNPAEREAFVRNACDGDEALRREVESLLQYESRSSGFLESPAAVMAGALEGAPAGHVMPGRQLGPYTIVAPLGAGGMGEVYRARDTQARSRRGDQDPAVALHDRSRAPRPLRARSAHARRAQSSAHRRHLRPRRERRRDRAGSRAGRGRDAGRSARAGPAARSPRRSPSRGRLPTRSTRRTRKASCIAI